jgi:hypothetical protein
MSTNASEIARLRAALAASEARAEAVESELAQTERRSRPPMAIAEVSIGNPIMRPAARVNVQSGLE